MIPESTMTVPVLIEETNGQYEAKLAGEPSLRAVAATRSDAISALKRQLQSKESKGELCWLSLNPTPISDLAGTWADRDDLDEMVAEIYRQRDAERPL
jgi:hypothetical protein